MFTFIHCVTEQWHRLVIWIVQMVFYTPPPHRFQRFHRPFTHTRTDKLAKYTSTICSLYIMPDNTSEHTLYFQFFLISFGLDLTCTMYPLSTSQYHTYRSFIMIVHIVKGLVKRQTLRSWRCLLVEFNDLEHLTGTEKIWKWLLI